MKAIVCSLLLALVAHKAQADQSCSQIITPYNYADSAGYRLTPTSCGMSYPSLDLNRIIAVQDDAECGACIEICGDLGCVSVLVVDQGDRDLYLSGDAFEQIFGQSETPASATWNQVDNSNCNGIMYDMGVEGRGFLSS